jgi:hypothetical protein
MRAWGSSGTGESEQFKFRMMSNRGVLSSGRNRETRRSYTTGILRDFPDRHTAKLFPKQ